MYVFFAQVPRGKKVALLLLEAGLWCLCLDILLIGCALVLFSGKKSSFFCGYSIQSRGTFFTSREGTLVSTQGESPLLVPLERDREKGGGGGSEQQNYRLMAASG